MWTCNPQIISKPEFELNENALNISSHFLPELLSRKRQQCVCSIHGNTCGRWRDEDGKVQWNKYHTQNKTIGECMEGDEEMRSAVLLLQLINHLHVPTTSHHYCTLSPQSKTSQTHSVRYIMFCTEHTPPNPKTSQKVQPHRELSYT